MQSTATGELLEKLAKAPKLDEQRFSLEGEVGKGGMGAVLEIHDRYLNRRLAMKVLLERPTPRDDDEKNLAHQLLGRFLEEAQVTSQLDHPGVVPVHELGLDANGKVWFTMRLVKGRTASEVFADAFAGVGEWNLTRALEVVLKVCDTMAYAHDKGVLHRDLKPSNVMVGRFGEVYVMDWGLAKVLGQADRHDLRIAKDTGTGVSRIESARKRDAETDTASSVVSMDGQQLGTPSYMPPEQARSEDLDARADVYAIGAMLYELLTGRAPYETPGLRQPAYRILQDVVERPCKRIEEIQKGVPAELVAIVEKAMARDRAQRFANVMELAVDLRAFLAQRTVKAYRTGALVEMKLWMRRNKALASSLAAAAVILVLGIAGTTVYAREADQRALAEATARTELTAKVKDFDQLAQVVTYERLIAAGPTLSPGWPDQVEAIDAWLRDARSLLAQRIELAETAARQLLPADPAAATAAQFLAKSLDDILAKLPKLEALLPEMEKRQRWSNCIGPLTLAHPNAKHTWAEARAAIAKADGVVASELYKGQDIPLSDESVWGLVPIGMNAESKLWEFYDLRSAWDGVQDPATLPIPQYGANGRLTITGETGIVFVLLPGGTLPPGTPAEDEGAKKRLAVRLDPFFLGKHEVTQGQWLRWTDLNPSETGTLHDLALPVERVSWLDADQVLCAQGLAIPSELQWEYGVRAATNISEAFEDGGDEHHVGADRPLLRVGSRIANGFGVFDMRGNVLEWCADEVPRNAVVEGKLRSYYGTERNGDGRRADSDDVGFRCIRGALFGVHRDFGVVNYLVFSPTSRQENLGLRAARASRRGAS
ncbi:MAG: protein kinase [Planctomycetes bacterium]|nr:protein kinase [Planctomycetota bacterium]